MLYKSSKSGSSTFTFFWVNVAIIFVPLYKVFMSLRDFCLPMVTGSTVPGKSTASLVARIGSVLGISISSTLDEPSTLTIGKML